MRITTQSVVRIEIEVRTGTYGSESTMDQIIQQASKEGVAIATRLLAEGKVAGRVVGEPKVLTVTTGPDEGLFGVLK